MAAAHGRPRSAQPARATARRFRESRRAHFRESVTIGGREDPLEALLYLAVLIALGVVMRWSLREDPLRKRKATAAPPSPGSAAGE
jgi:hypothetical protein